MPRSALLVVPVDRSGGAERVLTTLAAELVRRGDWQVAVVALAHRDAEPGPLEQLLGKAAVTTGRGNGRLLSEFNLFPILWGRQYDLVVSSHLRVNVFLAAMRRLGLLRTRRLVARESSLFVGRYGAVQSQLRRAGYLAYGPQDLVVAQTTAMAERLTKFLPRLALDRLAVVQNPIDLDLLASLAASPATHEFTDRLEIGEWIAWCGRLIDVKRPVLAVEVLSRLRSGTGRDFRLLMIGEGGLRDAVLRRASELGLAEYVLLAGSQKNPFPAIRRCRVGLLTSSLEGFPNVLLEMMACGLEAIVTTPCAGDLDTLAGVTVTASAHPRELAAAILSGLKEPATPSTYDVALASRSPSAFANRLLGELETTV